ncbi:MAG TPA: hypothetical protein DD490_21825 [Acidobacteria bacterium]|nr:hypothetical protein [Acidobacteriota bacterium]
MCLAALAGLLVASCPPAQALVPPLLTLAAMKNGGKAVGKFLLSFTADYLLSKSLDKLLDQGVGAEIKLAKSDLLAEVTERVQAMEGTSGETRGLLQEQLEQAEAQLANLDRVAAILEGRVQDVEAEVAEIRKEQAVLDRRIEALEQRTAALEKRVEELDKGLSALDARVSDLELALMRECLDLRTAPRLGIEEFRVQPGLQGLLEDDSDSERLSLQLRGHLNSCSPDLTQRGLLLQFSWITRELNQDMALYATFKHIEPGGFDRTRLNHLARLEFPLYRPRHRIDGQVLEVFIPYAEIPFPETYRLALALVVTHDGETLYSLPDRVIQCNAGQRLQCRWGR